MKTLKINQTMGVLLAITGFGWYIYSKGSAGSATSSLSGLIVMLLGLGWYGTARFMIWFKRD